MNDAEKWVRTRVERELFADECAVWEQVSDGNFVHVPLAVEDLIRAPLQSRLQAYEAALRFIQRRPEYAETAAAIALDPSSIFTKDGPTASEIDAHLQAYGISSEDSE